MRSLLVVPFLLPTLAGLATLACGPPHVDRPNVILLIGDDHGWPYFGFMGHPIVQTPHLDRLVAEGTLFPNAFTTSSSCRHSLLSLLTGLHPNQFHTRLSALRRLGLRRRKYGEIVDFETLPRRLAERGYASFQGGKYWEGTYDTAGFSHGMKDSVGPEVIERYGEIQTLAGGAGLELGRSTLAPLWEFLDAHREQPFFVWFAPKLPHTPHDAPEEYESRYAGHALTPEARRYYANISRFDDVVGELVAHLDTTGLRERTLLVYLSDNGWEQDPDDRPRVRSLGGTEGKHSMHELGFRSPLVFNWPGQIEAGGVDERLVSAVDLYPTLLEFAGSEAGPAWSGVSLAPLLLEGESRPGDKREWVVGTSTRKLRPPPDTEAARPYPSEDIVRPERAYYYRDATWRYIWYADYDKYADRQEDVLYHIAEDPRETNDVAADHPEEIHGMRAQILHWEKEATAAFRQRE